MSTNSDLPDDETGATRNATASLGITRRDFVSGVLIGTGSALLYAPSPARAQELGPAWTGRGGVGDYRLSNGDTSSVVLAGHRIRDHAYDGELRDVIDTDESYDVVIVGGGFAGLTALYEFQKRKPDGKCLLIDNQEIFGGFAKSNEFDVDGYRLEGPQASINFHLPKSPAEESEYWHEFGLPDQFQFARLHARDRSIVFSKGTSAPLYFGEQ